MKETTAPLTGAATESQIAEWNAKYTKKWYSIECDGHVAHFRNPDRNDMNCAMSQVTAETPLAYYEAIMRDTKIGGSDAILTDDDLFLGATQTMKEVLEGKKAKLVKH